MRHIPDNTENSIVDTIEKIVLTTSAIVIVALMFIDFDYGYMLALALNLTLLYVSISEDRTNYHEDI